MNASALTSRIRRSLGLAALSLATCVALVGHTAPAQAQTRIKMVLNWKYQGPQAWFFIAQDRGYFKAEGLDVEIDQGEGSSAPIAKIAAGAYTAEAWLTAMGPKAFRASVGFQIRNVY